MSEPRSEPDVSDLLTVAEAIVVIDAVAVSPRAVEMPLKEAMGLVLAEVICSDRDYPPFDKAVMDGYAVRARDVVTTPTRLRIVETIPAGAQSEKVLAAWQAAPIMTGAPIPPGADAVVAVEETSRASVDGVFIYRSAREGQNIARRASDVESGRVLLAEGTRLCAAQLAAVATVGAASIRVFAKPRVAVLSTGDELVPIDQTPAGAQIRNSNSLMIAALLERMGCDVTDLGIVRDTPTDTRAALEAGMKFDALFVTGGMSMGEFDYVPRTLIELGVELKITKLRIKPGKPFVFGVKDGSRFVFGLPGNPVSGFVCTVRLASRLIARMRGERPGERWVERRLASALPANGPREFYQPAKFDDQTVQPLKWKGSADIFTLALADGLIVRSENELARSVGEVVRVLEV